MLYSSHFFKRAFKHGHASRAVFSSNSSPEPDKFVAFAMTMAVFSISSAFITFVSHFRHEAQKHEARLKQQEAFDRECRWR